MALSMLPSATSHPAEESEPCIHSFTHSCNRQSPLTDSPCCRFLPPGLCVWCTEGRREEEGPAGRAGHQGWRGRAGRRPGGGLRGDQSGPLGKDGGRAGPEGGTKLRREDDDDSLDGDDSDVEVMSISSDEDESKKKTYKPGEIARHQPTWPLSPGGGR